MKQYDLIVGFGCSFMEGGGLDNPEIHMRMHGLEKPISIDEAEKFKYKNNFIAYLTKLYNCEYINLAESRCPNDLIFENIYNHFTNKKIDKKILMVGQISLFSRLYVYYEKTKQYLKLNSLDFNLPPFNGEEIYKDLYEYYKNYLSYVYNQNLIYKKIVRDIDTYTHWLNSIGIDCIWLAYDGSPDQFVESKNFIKFDGDNLGAWIEKNKLRLCDITELKTGDLHMSIKGHQLVAEKIYKHLNK
jgi:hypothetical protein